MDVDVSDHAQRAFLAHRPERAEVTSVETHDPGVEAVRIEIVIEDEVDDPAPTAFLPSKQEGAALAAGTPATLAECAAQAPPGQPGARQFLPQHGREYGRERACQNGKNSEGAV